MLISPKLVYRFFVPNRILITFQDWKHYTFVSIHTYIHNRCPYKEKCVIKVIFHVSGFAELVNMTAQKRRKKQKSISVPKKKKPPGFIQVGNLIPVDFLSFIQKANK